MKPVKREARFILYLSVSIVGVSVSALKNAVTTTVIEAGAIFYSDRGSVCKAESHRALLTRLGRQSSEGSATLLG